MKKLLFVILAILFVVTGCGKSQISTTEKILNHYRTICKTNDTSEMRNEVAELEKLSKDKNISKEEQMFAQYSFNVGYGVAKLSLSGKDISVFDFPEMETLSVTIALIAKNELELTDEMVSKSAEFVHKVEEFLQ